MVYSTARFVLEAPASSNAKQPLVSPRARRGNTTKHKPALRQNAYAISRPAAIAAAQISSDAMANILNPDCESGRETPDSA
jgi:hypothetical protein